MASLSPRAQPADDGSSWWSFPAPPSSSSSFADNTAKPSSTRRRCLQTFPISLPILPYTNHEWAKAVAEIKTDYANRQFHPCIKRCNEILNNLRDTTGVQPCYLIYLHFYAASAQETLARGLHHASPARMALLNEAQDHYSKASQLIASTDSVISRRSSKQGSISGSSISSLSSSSSYLLGDSPTSTGGSSRPESMWSPGLPPSKSSSRATSISSLDDDDFPTPKDVGSSSRVRRSRRSTRTSVYSNYSSSSSISTPRSIERPDSPTLGLPPLSECSFQDLLNAMPVPPPSRSMSLDTGLSGLPPVAPYSSSSRDSICSTTSSSSSSSFRAEHQEESCEDVLFPSTKSARRCSLLLTDLQGQISRHLSFIETDLVAAHNPPPTATNLGPDHKRCRSMELQARIERLRADGWRRPRFNPQRYEELRESAIADMLA